MEFKNTTLGGTFLTIGGIQWFLIGLLLAESWYPGYSSRIDYVSDLGIGPTALIYNASVFLLGVCVLVGAYFIEQDLRFKPFFIVLVLTGIGAMGVGLFPASIQPMHSLFTLIAILFASFSALVSYKILKPPLNYISVILGVISLISAIIFIPYLGLPTGDTTTYLGMAKGSMERWAINPVLAWIMVFGGYLVNKDGTSSE
jgi:hypothetical membrane protein